MTGLWSFFHRFRSVCVVLAVVLWLAACGTGVIAKDTPGGPDTPVSSDSAADAINAPAGEAPAGSASTSTGDTAQSNPAGAEIGSQANEKAPVSHEQEEKDRMFVDATFIAVAIILCVIAFFLFMSLPKPPKKAGSDNQ